MKILVISDFYPPEHKGGYEIRIESIVNAFIDYGNDVKVLSTFTSSSKNFAVLKYVKRILSHDNYEFGLIKRVVSELLFLRKIYKEINKFKPEVIYLGHVINYPKSLIFYLNTIHNKIVYDEGGIGLISFYFHEGAWFYFLNKIRKYEVIFRLFSVIFRLFLKNVPLEKKWNSSMFIIFNSKNTLESTINKGVLLKNFKVIQSGVDLRLFTFNAQRILSKRIKIIIPGRITQIKGQILAIPYLIKLTEIYQEISIDFPGKVEDVLYFKKLSNLLEKNDLLKFANFSGHLTHEKLAQKYLESHICLFTSNQKPGFSRVPIESLASGCLLFTFGYEGSEDFLVNHLAFGLAEGNDIVRKKYDYYLYNPKEYSNYIKKSRKFIENHYSLDGYLKNIVSTVNIFGNCSL